MVRTRRLLQYRGPKPEKLNLLVSDAEGPLPQLVAVTNPRDNRRR